MDFSKQIKSFEALNAKLEKAKADNKALKEQLALTKASTSRVRRVPKTSGLTDAAAIVAADDPARA
jgi:hypothetical protein